MAKKTWLFLCITTLLNIHNTIDGGTVSPYSHSLPSLRPSRRSAIARFMRSGCLAEVFMPYLYTRVRCCDAVGATLDPKYDEITFDANGSVAEAVYGCDIAVHDVESPEWSHSPTCVNFAYVRNTAQQVRGVYGPLTTILKVALLPMAGFLADMYGRKKVRM